MDGTKWTMKKILNDNYKCEGQMSIFDFIDKPKDEEAKAAAPIEDFMNSPEEAAKAADYKARKAYVDALLMKKHTEIEKIPFCEHSKHSCNKKELWKVADTLDETQCPHVCCRMCNTRNCGARCNGSEEPKKEIADDYIKENPTCFYVFGHYLDKADGWHKVPEELPTYTEWTTIDVVIFGKKTSTSWMEHEEWEAKDWTFRSKDQRRNTESTQILAWKISEDANKEIANG